MTRDTSQRRDPVSLVFLQVEPNNVEHCQYKIRFDLIIVGYQYVQESRNKLFEARDKIRVS